jgi:ferritin-like protein
VASEGYHEPVEWLDQPTIEKHRVVQSIVEEFQAADWYDQRVTACTDEALREILAHNRDEEKEHAAMTLEWLRRRDEVLDRFLRLYLFTETPITEIEEIADAADAAGDDDGPRPGSGSLGIGGRP